MTPSLNGDPAPSALRISVSELGRIFRDPIVVNDIETFCLPPPPPETESLSGYPCGAGHCSCYIAPTGDVMPCIQWPLVCGNVRRQKFETIWRRSEQLSRIRAIRERDLPVCRDCAVAGACSRCPGLAYMAGDLLGPSLLDCEKAFARTGLRPPPSVPVASDVACLPANSELR